MSSSKFVLLVCFHWFNNNLKTIKSLLYSRFTLGSRRRKYSNDSDGNDILQNVADRAHTETILIHSGNAGEGDSSWRRPPLNRVLEDRRNLDMRLREKNPGQEKMFSYHLPS